MFIQICYAEKYLCKEYSIRIITIQMFMKTDNAVLRHLKSDVFLITHSNSSKTQC